MWVRTKEGKLVELYGEELYRSDVYEKLWKMKFGKVFAKKNCNLSKVKEFVRVGQNVR